MMEKKRSVGVMVFGILCIFYPHLVTHLFTSSPLQESSITSVTLIDRSLYYSLNSISKISIYTIVSVVLFVAGLGILKLQTWARKLIVYFSCLVVVLHLFIYSYLIICMIGGWHYYFGSSSLPFPFQIKEFFLGVFSLSTFLLFNTSFFILSLFYFTRPKVKRAFGERNPEQSEG
jgi:uncharacterized Tic20 family protein